MRASLDDFNDIPDMDIVTADQPANPVIVETWREFADKAGEAIPCIVEDLWPEGAIGFIASPPKKGKTWLALSLALSVATGSQFLTKFDVTTPRPVLYLALEGHRAALTHRVACMARGVGLNPDEEIPNFHLAYKPRSINLADPKWAEHITQRADELNAQLVIVDVLRAAAVMKENSNDDFAALIANLASVFDGVRSLAFLHHFTKLSETSKEREPGERMAGGGAKFGALDVAIYITGSENNARNLRVEFDSRDIASPSGLGLVLNGKGSGQNGGFNYHDKAWWTIADAPDEDDVQAPAEDILEWLKENGPATRAQIAMAFDVSEKTIARREVRLLQMGVKATRKPPQPLMLGISAEPGQAPGQDNQDSVQDTPLSMLDPFADAGLLDYLDSLDTSGVSRTESADLQGFHVLDNLDSPTERDHPVSGSSLRDDDLPL